MSCKPRLTPAEQKQNSDTHGKVVDPITGSLTVLAQPSSSKSTLALRVSRLHFTSSTLLSTVI